MMLRILFALSIYSVFMKSCICYPFGPPISQIVCETLIPLGHIDASKPGLEVKDYTISVSKEWFSPNEVIDVNISSPSQPFKGLLLHVKSENERISGSFVLPQNSVDFKFYGCNYVIEDTLLNSTVSHANGRSKTVGSFRWVAPPSCDGSVYEIKATILKSVYKSQFGVIKRLECRPNSAHLSEHLLGPEHNRGENNVCQYSGLTSVPEQKYQTSFENGTVNGWHNVGWRFNKGPTFTSNTGPSSAIDGTSYLYYETSYSKNLRRRIVLETDTDLRGCFCIKFKHSHNVDDRKNHQLQVKVGEEIVYKTVSRKPSWKGVSVQADSPDFTKVQIIGIRGSNFRGDMAIDDVRIVQGLCSSNQELL